MRRKLSSDRIAAAAAVLIFHLLVIALLIRADRLARTDRSEEESTNILYLLSSSPHVRHSSERARAARHGHRRRARRPAGPRTPLLAVPRPPLRVIPVPSGPKVDWYRQAEVVAHALAGARGTDVHPGSGEHEHSPYHKCAPSPGFAWDPQPKTVGFIGLMPYLRTKRCFITLISFGCFIGKLPEPNGKLLDSIRDGPVTYTSVPEDDNCDK